MPTDTAHVEHHTVEDHELLDPMLTPEERRAIVEKIISSGERAYGISTGEQAWGWAGYPGAWPSAATR